MLPDAAWIVPAWFLQPMTTWPAELAASPMAPAVGARIAGVDQLPRTGKLADATAPASVVPAQTATALPAPSIAIRGWPGTVLTMVGTLQPPPAARTLACTLGEVLGPPCQ